MAEFAGILVVILLAAALLIGPFIGFAARRSPRRSATPAPQTPAPPGLPRQPAGFTALPAESDPVTDALDAGRIEGKLRKRRASGFGALVEREPEMVARLLSGLIRDDRNR